MTTVADIGCPECGSVREVRKVAVGRYRCGECGNEFGPGDLGPTQSR